MEGDIGFDKRCYELIREIPAGKVTTYREIARALNTRAWRAVGSAMARNKTLIVVPCHRVVRSDGAVGQYALGGDQKAHMLSSEGVEVENGTIKELEKYLHRYAT